ncbi:hypothetical protein [Actinomadura flavalba]|uniref:hypothetical protein n=1 Tax=Actinomadura flavalba TaxID=1120938 RepID=UPI0003A2CB95|nr:hypothetical protein [Actinomadura flavalba]
MTKTTMRGRAAALVLAACAGLAAACGDITPAAVPAGAPTDTPTPTSPAPAPTSPSPAPTPTPTPTVARPDAAARAMCTRTALALAHHRAGNRAQSRAAWGKAKDAATLSSVPAVRRLGAGSSAGAAWRWCGTHAKVALPKVRKAPKTHKPAPAPRTPSRPNPPATRTVTPGAFCSPPGATGVSKVGRPYTCKGPGQPRWRR